MTDVHFYVLIFGGSTYYLLQKDLMKLFLTLQNKYVKENTILNIEYNIWFLFKFL